MRISPLHDHREQFLGWAIFINDISIRKIAEKELESANKRLKEQLSEIQELQEKLREQAFRDSLTGVYNRRYLDETLPRELARAAREGCPLSVIMLDIDNFKSINDTYGHKIGDDVISALGGLLRTQTRDGDCVGRYGEGDEFVLILPGMSKKDALKRAELWREAIKAMLFQVGDAMLRVTISLGVAAYPENGMNNEALMKSVDDALYQAKEMGRDQICAAE